MSPWDFFSRFRSERLRKVNPVDEFRTTFAHVRFLLGALVKPPHRVSAGRWGTTTQCDQRAEIGGLQSHSGGIRDPDACTRTNALGN